MIIVPCRQLLPEAIRLSARYRVTVYDALFVALTVAIGAAGISADEPLVNAVKRDFPQIHLLRDWPPSGS
jgi:predicted nucleic acid-binding protein